MMRLVFSKKAQKPERKQSPFTYTILSSLVSISTVLMLAACDNHKKYSIDTNKPVQSNAIEKNRKNITEEKQNKRSKTQQSAPALAKKGLSKPVESKTIESKTIKSKSTEPSTKQTPPKATETEMRKPLNLRLDDVTISSIQRNCQSRSFGCLGNNKKAMLPDMFTQKEEDNRFNISGDLERDAEKELLDIKAIKGGEVSIDYKFQ